MNECVNCGPQTVMRAGALSQEHTAELNRMEESNRALTQAATQAAET